MMEMCMWQPTLTDAIIAFTVKIFLLIWIIFVPIVITSRLERIIKLLDELKKK